MPLIPVWFCIRSMIATAARTFSSVLVLASTRVRVRVLLRVTNQGAKTVQLLCTSSTDELEPVSAC
jgi:hypothetical protein